MAKSHLIEVNFSLLFGGLKSTLKSSAGLIKLFTIFCSVIGATVIVAGFYAVIWAQSKEEDKGKSSEVDGVLSPSQKTPLLESQRDV